MARKKKKIEEIIDAAITVPEEELAVTGIAYGQQLSTTLQVLGIPDARVVDLTSDEILIKNKDMYISERGLENFPEAAPICRALGIDIRVKVYDADGIPIYFVTEPKVTDLTKKLYVYFKTRLGEIGLTQRNVLELAKEVFDDIGIDPRIALSEPSVKAAVYYLWRDLLGYGPLEIPMEDDKVEEVSWFSYDGPVLVVDKEISDKYPATEFTFTNIMYDPILPREDRKFFMTQVVRAITSRARAGLTTARPLAEARVPDPTGRGFHRLAAHLDITSRSPAVTIRKFPKTMFTLAGLIARKTINPIMAAHLVYQLVNRGFILIVGGMASGKTTLLQALISVLPISYKVITIEDTPELRTPAFNWHPLYVRRTIGQTELENVDFSRLVIHSLRHRGTVVTLGEVRGKEMADLIQAAASGHGAICLRPDAVLLVRRKGSSKPFLLTMKELYSTFARGNSIEVLSFSEKGPVWKRVSKVFKVAINVGRWIRVYTASGRVLDMTPGHRMPVLRGNRVKVLYAYELSVGDKILVSPSVVEPEKKRTHIIINNKYVELNYSVGKLYGVILAHGRIYSRRASVPKKHVTKDILEVAESLGSVKERPRTYSFSIAIVRLVERLNEIVSNTPLSLPREFVQGFYDGAGPSMVYSDDKKLLAGIHFMLRTIRVDSVFNDTSLLIRGKIPEYVDVIEDTITRIESIDALNEEAYDIEVEDTHNFITDSSIISSNCTFHAHDPESVLMRITSPPINAAPEALKLITSIVHISQVMVYAGGDVRKERRVVRIFEIKDVQGRRPISTTLFTWDPETDTHIPAYYPDNKVKTLASIVKLYKNSHVWQILGEIRYGSKEPYRIVSDLYLLSRFFYETSRKPVFTGSEKAYINTAPKALLLASTAFYLQLPRKAKEWWEKNSDIVKKLLEIV